MDPNSFTTRLASIAIDGFVVCCVMHPPDTVIRKGVGGLKVGED